MGLTILANRTSNRQVADMRVSSNSPPLRWLIAILIAVLLMLGGCTPPLPSKARDALGVIFRDLPVVFAKSVDVEGFAEFWCVILGLRGQYTLGSVHALKDYDGGWNASVYDDRSIWENRCGPVPKEYADELR